MNPILAAMANSNTGGIADRIGWVKQLIAGKDPKALYGVLMNSNPQFAEFVRVNKGKSPEQIAQDYGIDLGTVRSLLK